MIQKTQTQLTTSFQLSSMSNTFLFKKMSIVKAIRENDTDKLRDLASTFDRCYTTELPAMVAAFAHPEMEMDLTNFLKEFGTIPIVLSENLEITMSLFHALCLNQFRDTNESIPNGEWGVWAMLTQYEPEMVGAVMVGNDRLDTELMLNAFIKGHTQATNTETYWKILRELVKRTPVGMDTAVKTMNPLLIACLHDTTPEHLVVKQLLRVYPMDDPETGVSVLERYISFQKCTTSRPTPKMVEYISMVKTLIELGADLDNPIYWGDRQFPNVLQEAFGHLVTEDTREEYYQIDNQIVSLYRGDDIIA